MSETGIALRLVITGRVQRVGYRRFMVRAAHDLGITGWVRNRADGSVEAVVAGAPGAVDALVELARRGPAAAMVERVDLSPADGNWTEFSIGPAA